MKLETIIFIIGIVLVITFAVADSQEPINRLEEESSAEEGITRETIIEDCKNLSLTGTAYCLRDNVKKIYNYTKTSDSINLTFSQLVEQGGDCRNYAFLYSDLAGQLNFENNTFHIPKHRFAVISKDGDFCIINLLRVECFI